MPRRDIDARSRLAAASVQPRGRRLLKPEMESTENLAHWCRDYQTLAPVQLTTRDTHELIILDSHCVHVSGVSVSVRVAGRSHDSAMNLNAKSIALRWVLKVFTMFSIEVSALSTPSRYARR